MAHGLPVSEDESSSILLLTKPSYELTKLFLTLRTPHTEILLSEMQAERASPTHSTYNIIRKNVERGFLGRIRIRIKIRSRRRRRRRIHSSNDHQLKMSKKAKVLLEFGGGRGGSDFARPIIRNWR